jgi:hypothetical protein
MRRERRRNVAKRIAAAGALFAADDIGAEPVAVGFTSRIDALHGAAGQKLHEFFSAGRQPVGRFAAAL